MAKSGVKLKPDSTLRRKFYIEESFSHPAKMHIGMFQEILARYDIQPGSLLLDPMAGSGTCLLACLQGINVIANEMEQHFIVPMLASWQKIRQHGPMLGYQMGQALIIRGDARMLPLASADSIVTSPPFEDQLAVQDNDFYRAKRIASGRNPDSPHAKGISSYTRPADARSLPLGTADCVVTSPPYEDSQSSVGGNQLDRVNITYQPDPATAHRRNVPSGVQRPAHGYTRPVDARSLPLGTADCVVTSPPYEGSIADGDNRIDQSKWANPVKHRNGGPYAQVNGYSAYTRPDAIITSPPYEGCDSAFHDTFQPPHEKKPILHTYTRPDVVITSPPYADMADAKRHPGDGLESEKGHVLGYTRPDVVVTSPPYGDTKDVAPFVLDEPYLSQYIERFNAKHGKGRLSKEIVLRDQAKRSGLLRDYGNTNIGNLRNSEYWESMRLVYQECHRVLKDAGLMILVVKGYTRDHEYVDLPQQTVDLVETLGFKLIDRWERELWQLSFWRILQARKHGLDERLKYETVIAFRKK